MPSHIAALEIGTARVRALVGEPREDGLLMVTGRGECGAVGVRKGAIVDFENALDGVRRVLQAAEEQARVSITQVYLVLCGADIRSEVNRGIVHVLNEEGAIRAAEMEEARKNARKVTLPADREILHSIAQCYYVDAQQGVVNPEGMEGRQLALDMLIAHGQGAVLRNTIRVARSIPADVEDVAFGGLCAALAVLTPEQKQSGVALVDLGAGTTDVLVYAGPGVALAASLSVGGDHVTNDIALGLRIPTAQAERLKREHGRAVPRPGDGAPAIILPAEGGFPGRTVLRADLDGIVHARMDETLGLVRAMLAEAGLLAQIGAGVVLTGGGARMTGIRALAERTFNAPCAIGRPGGVGGIAAVRDAPEYAAAVGMLRYAAITAQRDGGGGRLREWLASLLGAVRPAGRRGDSA